MSPRKAVRLPLNELVVEGEERNPGLSWPLAVDAWLERRLEQAREAGMSTSRKELAAALMTAVQPTDDQLVDLLRRYRRMSIGDLLNMRDDESETVTYLKQRPGPRSTRRVGTSRRDSNDSTASA